MTGGCEGHECRIRETGGRAVGRTAAGYRLCASCHRRLTLDIRQLPDLYRDCERMLGGAWVKGLRERTSGGSLPGAPFNAAAAEARAAIMGVLGAWSGLVAQERRVSPPRRAIGSLSVFLLRHSDWLATHPAAAEATRELARLVTRAHRVAHPEQVRRIALGDCVERGCDGRLFATVRVGAPGTHPAVQCDADPLHIWAGHQWTQLRRLMPRSGPGSAGGAGTGGAAGGANADRAAYGGGTAADVGRTKNPATGDANAGPVAHGGKNPHGGHSPHAGPSPNSEKSANATTAGTASAPAAERWLTAGDISRLWNTPVGSVYRLASEQRWRRHHRSGRTYYSEADAHDCFSRRAERSRQG